MKFLIILMVSFFSVSHPQRSNGWLRRETPTRE